MTLLDGIFETVSGLQRRETPRAVVVPVITDGVEFTTHYFRDIVNTLVKNRVALHMVTIGPFYHDEEHGTRERSFLLDAGPRESGGQRISLLSAHGLDNALDRLAKELRAAVQGGLQPAGIADSAGQGDGGGGQVGVDGSWDRSTRGERSVTG